MSAHEIADAVASSPEVLAFQARCRDQMEFEKLRTVIIADVTHAVQMAEGRGFCSGKDRERARLRRINPAITDGWE